MALQTQYLLIRNELNNSTIEKQVNAIINSINTGIGESFQLFPIAYDYRNNNLVQPMIITKEISQTNEPT
jgi:signal transduction histidine kinase